MNLKQIQYVLAVIGLIGILILSSPLLSTLFPIPNGEPFSELYLLGPQHTANGYPTEIGPGKSSFVYVDVSNEMFASQYYMLYFKLGNSTNSLPNPLTGSPSSLNPLYEYRFAIANGKTIEFTVTFSVVSASNSTTQAVINVFQINGLNFNVNEATLLANSTSSGLYYRFIAELWIYNPQTQSFQYDNRFVDLRLQFV